MVQRVQLANGNTVWVCEICGHGDRVVYPHCSAMPIWQRTNLKVGDQVGMWWHWGRYIRYSHWTIRGIRYAGPGFAGWVRGRHLPLHALIVEVAQNMNNQPWKEGDSSYQGTEVAYSDFLLWQEGDEERLRAAGLIAPLTFLQRVQKRLGHQPASIKRPA